MATKITKTKRAKAGKHISSPKPYTEYTIFFRLERSYLVQSSGGKLDDEVKASLDPNHRDALEFPRPERYKNVIMPPYWYSSAHKAAIEKKRKHRKSEGRMDLKTLSKTISAIWKNADDEIVEYCRKLAWAELRKYNVRVENLIRVDENKFNGKLFIKDCDIHLAAEQPKATSLQSATQPLLLNEALLASNFNFNRFARQGQAANLAGDQALLPLYQMRQQLQLAHANNTETLPFSSNTNAMLSTPIGSAHALFQSVSDDSDGPNKRRCTQRVSAPPIMGNVNNRLHSMLSSNMSSTFTQMLQPPKKLYCHRASTPSIISDVTYNLDGSFRPTSANDMDGSFHPVSADNMIGSFHPVDESKELHDDSSKLACVPKWEEEDADTLLDILDDGPQIKDPIICMSSKSDIMNTEPRPSSDQIAGDVDMACMMMCGFLS